MRRLFLIALFAAAGCSDSATGGADTDAAVVLPDGAAPADGAAPDAATPDAAPAGCAGDHECPPEAPFCEGGACAPCRDGAVGCPCDEGTCGVGECIEGTCVDCDRGEAGCVCRANGTCEAGQRCDGGRCVACADGLEGCPCGAGCGPDLACAAGVCVPDTCIAGEPDCPCDGDRCGAGLYCADSAVCRACSSDVEGCPCAPGGTCDGGLRCADDVCAPCPDADKPAGCPCVDHAECGAGLACDEADFECRPGHMCADCLPNQLCEPAERGDARCVPETCVEGFTWDGEACVAVVGRTCDGRDGSTAVGPECEARGQTCIDIAGEPHCVDTCLQLGPDCAAQHRTCDPAGAGGLAQCAECLPGYRAEGDDMPCTPDPDANCVPDAPGGLVETCAAQRRPCVDTDEGAVCGACLEGYREDPATGACVAGSPCAGRSCGDDEYCEYPQDGSAPRCVAVPCGPGEAADAEGQCVACDVPCADGVYPVLVEGQCACREQVHCAFQFDGASPRCTVGTCPSGQARSLGGECVNCAVFCGDNAGETVRLWPDQTRDGSCLCETQPGWYLPLGGDGRPRQCDADGDGWINRTAQATLDVPDAAVQANFRCERRNIDRVIMQIEDGQRRSLSVCEGRLIMYPQVPQGCPSDIETVGLVEPDVLDNDGAIQADDAQFPTYGGRKLRAAELNPLTKACVSLTGDFNDNGVEDVTEEQLIEPERAGGAAIDGGELLLRSVTHFAELHTSTYEPGPPGAPGRIVVAEKSRCSGDFPLGYSSGTYWRNCTRRRDARFSRAGSLVGQDFAWWSCDDDTGPCPTPDGYFRVGVGDADGDGIRDHDLCQAHDFSIFYFGTWRGMSHHSQFRCVALKDVPEQPWELALRNIHQEGPGQVAQRFELNVCGARPCEGDEAACSRGDGVQPRSPVLDCAVRGRDEAAVDDVGFAAVRFSAVGDYFAGCIAEGAEPSYAQMCGRDGLGSVPVSSADFGRLRCNECGGGAAGACDDGDVCTADGCGEDGQCTRTNACPPGACPLGIRQCIDPNGHRTAHPRAAITAASTPVPPRVDDPAYFRLVVVATYPYLPRLVEFTAPPSVRVLSHGMDEISCPRGDGRDCGAYFSVNVVPAQGGGCLNDGLYRFRFAWDCAPGADCSLIDPATPHHIVEIPFCR